MRTDPVLISTGIPGLDSDMPSDKPLAPTIQSHASQVAPIIAIGGDRDSTQARPGKENQGATNVQSFSLPITSKGIEIKGLVHGQIIEIRSSREAANLSSWAPILSSSVSVIIGGCIAAAASYFATWSQARSAQKAIAAQNLREEIKTLADWIDAVGSSVNSSQTPGTRESLMLLMSKCKTVKPISHFLDDKLEEELLQLEKEAGELLRRIEGNSRSTAMNKFLLGEERLENQNNDKVRCLNSRAEALLQRLVESITRKKRCTYEKLGELNGGWPVFGRSCSTR
jgi:hypothetical protein